MRIVHIAISCFYIEGWGYQENLLPKYHKIAGHDVYMISSRFDKDEHNKPCTRPAGEYTNNDGIKVTILDYATPSLFQKLLRLQPVDGLYSKLEQINPDIIFVHGGGSVASLDVVEYIRNHKNVRLFADQHADYYNSPVDSLKRKLIAKCITGYFVRSLAKYTETYWGVTPWRVDYLHNVYGLSEKKLDLLVMGADDEFIRIDKRKDIKVNLCKGNNIPIDSFLIVSGGKIDKTKNIHTLMKAVSGMHGCKNIELVIYGSIGEDVKCEVETILQYNSNIHYIGWLNNKQIIDWMLAADLVVFPGTHSVLWESCVACGTPMIVNDWLGMHHVDIGGNCKFVDGSNEKELANVISDIIETPNEYANMVMAANTDRRNDFLYSHIAKRSINGDQSNNKCRRSWEKQRRK